VFFWAVFDDFHHSLSSPCEIAAFQPIYIAHLEKPFVEKGTTNTELVLAFNSYSRLERIAL